MITNYESLVTATPWRARRTITASLLDYRLPTCPDPDHYIGRLLEAATSGAIFMVFDQYCHDHSLFCYMPRDLYQLPWEIAREHYVSILPRDTCTDYSAWIRSHESLAETAVEVAVVLKVLGWATAFQNYMVDHQWEFHYTPFDLLVNDLIQSKLFTECIFIQSRS